MAPSTFNVNVGILGHVDSGKTSLARALSTMLSTASLDKHPQSAERGITLDLGFSGFSVPTPDDLKASLKSDFLQFTLVDCPGHASLIRTIIGGAQIIDLMMLVVDVTKGIQTQTAECLVVGEILTQHMVVVLNKTDMLPEATRAEKIEKMKKRLALTLHGTKFSGCDMVAVSARPGGAVSMEPTDDIAKAMGMDTLVAKLLERVPRVPRCLDGPFLFAVDHCFSIKGQGTVLTGTVLQGSVEVNQTVEVAHLKVDKKVKSMQMFHKSVPRAQKGDRLGICVTQLDAKLIERGLLAEPRSVPTIDGAIAAVDKIRFFKGAVASKARFHVTIGHTTVMASVVFFAVPLKEAASPAPQISIEERVKGFSFDREYAYTPELHAPPKLDKGGGVKKPEEGEEEAAQSTGPQFAVITFESPVTCPLDSLLIGSRFDADIHTNTCRLAFHGRLVQPVDPKDAKVMSQLRMFKLKFKEGAIDRVNDAHTAIGKGLFKKETDINLFVGMKVKLEGGDGEIGTIQGSFGKSGKYKISFPGGIPLDAANRRITMHFKRFVFDKTKKMWQT